ncbi:beta-lactamase domain protein [Stackebrandtia nassauensis DSM 44728]|uniref:Beta-lactamase domain protein n=1 Tax=Stackebrandtia nassauensis (strain DSM 44728 / CIP 108903 / NRRL B-16338 / NBRC 102104 / LLR-40K-21) TaxID=446470 RepID=D3QAY0_STANL|nr:beta-lactamase domain protein [Stackebrandtia nassauensis DSM 44728]
MAAELLSPDAEVSERACAAVGKLLDAARRANRRALRAQRRAARPDADTKRTARLEQRITQLRAVRDRLDGQVSTLSAENAELRSTIDNLDGELEQLRRHLDVAYARMDRVQTERDEALRQAERAAPRVSVGADLSVSVRVLGGGTEIGGSCVLITGGGTRLLVDAGTRPSGVDEDSLAPADIAEVYAEPPDAIVVTHAHNDHAGWVPALVNRFPNLPVFASTATCDLLGTMWADSAKVLAFKADTDESWAGGPLPPYKQSDVDAAVAALIDVPVGHPRRVGALSFELFDAGHIIGATGVVVTAGDQRVVVSGDVSGPGQLSVGGLHLPDAGVGADLLLLESTYAGAGKLPPREAVIDQFVSDVDRILGAGGRVLVPAFALGRAQEIALICGRHLPDAEVLVDGMARDLSHAYRRHDGPDGERVQVFSGRVRPVEPGRTRREIADKRPCVVVATSGMLSGGPAVGWAREILTEPESGLMVVGYQDADSPGSRLLGLAAAGGGRFDLPGMNEPIEVSAHIGNYRLGAHASEDDLVKIAAEARPQTLMLVHGRLAAQRRFADRLRLRQQKVILADRPWSS